MSNAQPPEQATSSTLQFTLGKRPHSSVSQAGRAFYHQQVGWAHIQAESRLAHTAEALPGGCSLLKRPAWGKGPLCGKGAAALCREVCLGASLSPSAEPVKLPAVKTGSERLQQTQPQAAVGRLGVQATAAEADVHTRTHARPI